MQSMMSEEDESSLPRSISETDDMSEQLESRLSAVLDAVKNVISGGSGDVEVAIYARSDDGANDVSDVLEAYRRLRSLIALQNLREEDGCDHVRTTVKTPAFTQVLQVLHRSLSTANPGGEPVNAEAQRQLLFFCNSLRNRWMPKACPVRNMRTCSSFTPYFKEDVSYSESALKSMGYDGVNLENLLQALFAHDWHNLCERVRRRGDDNDPVPYPDLKDWSSDRAQVLSRTVRGVMLYGDALRIQARLEGVAEEEIEALVDAKFEYLVTCQDYQKFKESEAWDD